MRPGQPISEEQELQARFAAAASRLHGGWLASGDPATEVALREGRCRARRLLVIAAQRVNLWRDLLSGADPAQLPWDRLPVIDRSTLMARLDATFSDPRLSTQTLAQHIFGTSDATLYDRYVAFYSTGAAGTPLYCVYDEPTWVAYGSVVLRALHRIGADPDLPVALLGSDDIRHTLPRLAPLFRLATVVGLQDGVGEAWRRLSDAAPRVLIGYSSALALAARAQLAGRLNIRPEHVLAGTDALSDEDIQAIDAAWGAYPYSYYSATEAGVIGSECGERDGLHLNMDVTAVEILGGDLIVSQLTNEAQPIVRYRLPDAVRMAAGDCHCGSASARLHLARGRNRPVLRVPAIAGGLTEIHPIVLRSALDSIAPAAKATWDAHRQAMVVDAPAPVRDIARVAVGSALARAGAATLVLSGN